MGKQKQIYLPDEYLKDWERISNKSKFVQKAIDRRKENKKKRKVSVQNKK